MREVTTTSSVPRYEPPRLTVIGTVHELTQGCDKKFGHADGFTFIGIPIVCRSG
jgi:hypothetical protein